MSLNHKLTALRALMQERNIDAYILPSSDPHQSEYLPDHWKGREWLSGFTGSAGILVVTHSFAGLWTDGRYFLQAEHELEGSGIQLQKQTISHAPEHISWLLDHLDRNAIVGIDGRLFSIRQIGYMEKLFRQKGISLNLQADLLSPLWKERPALPSFPIFEHDTFYAGVPRKEKIQQIRDDLRQKQVDWLLTSTLDDIGWVLNLRGSDVECNPLFIAYLLIGPQSAVLFTPTEKVSPNLRENLEKEGILLRPYHNIEVALKELPQEVSVFIDPDSANSHLNHCLLHTHLVFGKNPITERKAIKNQTEIFHIRQVMRNDGVALTKLLMWLEEQLHKGFSVNEFEIAEKLKQFRALHQEYKGESFPAIIGYNANGAIIHYRPQPHTAANIQNEGILLLDSGGQYLNGTTDITRTIALGKPSVTQKKHFTLVLKGHIALASAHFPKGTIGIQLDTLARAPLWKQGLNFSHGTGHGVGFFLCVHEGPQGFASSAVTSRGTTPITPGMLTSNEPGLYLPGQYGIRIENLLLCQTLPEDQNPGFYAFETVSLFPIDLGLIETSILSLEEKTWLNDYHARVFEELSPLLDKTEQQWLAEKCRKV
jgi:Xaa-Pro aminopeptidase